MNGPTRRALLGTLAGGAGLALAGCVGDSDDEPQDTGDADSDDGSGPGFGVIVSVLALLAAALLAARRNE